MTERELIEQMAELIHHVATQPPLSMRQPISDAWVQEAVNIMRLYQMQKMQGSEEEETQETIGLSQATKPIGRLIEKCDRCNGWGYILARHRTRCPKCRGTGRVQEYVKA